MSASFALAAAAGGFSCVEMAEAGPIEVPTVDKLSVRVLVDSASDIFFKPQEVNGVKTQPGRSADSPDEIRSVANSYKAFYAKVPDARGGDYSIDHAGVIYLLGRGGEYLGFMPPQTSPGRLTEILRKSLAIAEGLWLLLSRRLPASALVRQSTPSPRAVIPAARSRGAPRDFGTGRSRVLDRTRGERGPGRYSLSGVVRVRSNRASSSLCSSS
jgi:hypothetical protein